MIDQIQSDLDQLKEQSRENLEKLHDRGESLAELENKTEEILQTSEKFKDGARSRHWIAEHPVATAVVAGATFLVTSGAIFFLL